VTKLDFPANNTIWQKMTLVRLPKIGTIVRNNDGSYDISPLPDIGGPFETATAFYSVWTAHAKFLKSRDRIQKSMKSGLVNEVLTSIADFPIKLRTVAGRISSCDSVPLPL
jgi:hypothetical protein